MSNYINSRFSLLFSLFFLSLSLLSAQDTPISRFQQYLRINTAHPNPNYAAAVTFLNSQSHSIPDLRSQILHLASPHKPLLLLTLPGTNPNLPSILFNSHLDSVPAEPSKWTHDPFAAVHTADGKIHARGSQDDKCIGVQYLEALRNLKDLDFKPVRTIHVLYVPDEEIGGFDGMAKFVESKEFEELNVGFVLDEGQASTNNDFRVFYADRTPWHLVIKASGMPGHGSRMYDNSAMENLMKSVEVISKFRDNQFDIVKAGWAANSEVISVNPVYLKAGIPSPTGFVMNMQPSEAEAGFDVRLPPTTDPIFLKKIIAEQWAPATKNMTYELTEKGPLRDLEGRPLTTVTNASNPWWTAFEQAISAVGAKLSKPEILVSTTDARFMRQRGIPTLGFSPMKNTPILLHDHNEFLKDTVYLEGIKVYESIIKALSSLDIQFAKNPGIPSGHESSLPKAEDGIRSVLAKGLVLCKRVVNKAKSLHDMRQIASKASQKVISFNEKIRFTELVSSIASIIIKKVGQVVQKFQVNEKTKSAFAVAKEKVGSTGSMVTQKVQEVDQSLQVSAKAISAFAIAEEKVGSASSMIGEKVREVDQKLQVYEKVKSAFSVAEEKMGVAGSMVNEKVREMDQKLQFSEKVKSAFAVAKEKVGSAGSMVTQKVQEVDQSLQVSAKAISAFAIAEEKVGSASSMIGEKVREVDQKLQVSEKVKSAFSVAEEKMGVAGSMVNEKVREMDQKLQFSVKVKSAFAVAKEKVGSAGSMVTQKVQEVDQSLKVSAKAISAFAIAEEKVGSASSMIGEKVREVDQKLQVSEKVKSAFSVAEEKMGVAGSMVNEKVREMDQKLQFSEKVKSAFAVAKEKVGSAGSMVTQKVQEVDQSLQVSAKAISAFAIAEEKVGSASSMIGEKVREVDQKLQVSEKVKSAFSVTEEKMGVAEMGVAGSMVNEKVREMDQKLQFSEKVKSAFAVAKEKVGNAGSMVSDKVREGDQKLQVSEKVKSAFVDAGEKVGIAGSAIMKNKYVSESVDWAMGVFNKVKKAGAVEDEQKKMVDGNMNML